MTKPNPPPSSSPTSTTSDGSPRSSSRRLQFGQGVALARATKNDLYFALARTVRQQLMSRWLETLGTQMQAKAKAVAYLSAEYLLGANWTTRCWPPG